MISKYFIPQIETPLVDPNRLSGRDRLMFEEYGIAAFPNRSFGNSAPLAPKPNLNVGGGSKVFSGQSNASITFGEGRGSGGLTDGLGGKGITSPTIDLCVGHMGAYARNEDDSGQQILCNPNFQVDAGRIYATALCEDINEVMQLPEGSLGSKKMASAVGIMAENVNIQAQGEGGVQIASFSTNRNKRGQKNLKNPGIDLLASDGTDQQPIVKGWNLVEALSEMSTELDDLRGTMEQFVRLQGNFNDRVMDHNHHGSFNGIPTAPSFNLMYEGYKQCFQRVADVETGMIFNIINKESARGNYFNPIGEKFILSGLVYTS